MSGMTDVGGMIVSYSADISGLGNGITQAKSQMSSLVDAAATSTTALKGMSGAADGAKIISNVDVAQARLTLLESKAAEARTKLQELQNAADAGKAVTGIPEAEAQLTLLEADAQRARQGLQELQSQEEQTGAASSGGFLSGIKSAVTGITDFMGGLGKLQWGYQAITGAAQGFYDHLLKGNADMEQTDVAFETLLGKGKKTQDFLQSLKDFAAATPFEFPELATDAQHMIAFGFAAKDVIPDLTNIGDAMGSMGKSNADIDHIVEVFGQMHAAGKLNAGDMMQIADEGIPAWKMLADQMGKTVPEVQKLSSQGLIPADVAIKAVSDGMHKMFGGGMAAQANTFNGLMSTLQDNASAALRAFTGPLFEAAKSGLLVLGNLVSSKSFQDFATNTGKQIAGVFGQIGQAIQTLKPYWDNFQAAFLANGTGFSTLGIMFMDIGKTLLTLGGIFAQLSPSLQLFGDLWKNLTSLTTQVKVFDAIDLAIIKLTIGVQNIMDAVQGFSDWLSKGGIWVDVFKDSIIGVSTALGILKGIQLGQMLIGFIAMLPEIIVGWGAWAAGAWAAAAGTIAATWPILAIGVAIAIVVAIIVLAVTHWGDITKFLQGAWAGFTSWFMGLINGIGAWFQGVWTGIATWFSGVWTSIFGAAKATGGQLSSWWAELWTGIVNLVVGFGQHLLDALLSPFTGVVKLFEWLYNHNYYFQMLVDSIVAAFIAVGAWIQVTWTQITSWLATTWQAIGDTGRSIWAAVAGFFVMIWQGITSAATTAWNGIVAWFTVTWDHIVAEVKIYWAYFVYYIKYYINQAVSWLTGVWTAVSKWFTALWVSLTTPIITFWNWLGGIFNNAWSTYIAKPLAGIWTSITKWFSDLGTSAYQSGTNFISMLVSGINSGVGSIYNAVSNIAGTIWRTLGFHSPAKEGPGSDADKWMPNLIGMFTSGLTQGVPKVQAASTQIAQAIAYPIKPSATAVAASVAPASSLQGNGGGGSNTYIFEMDGLELARMVGNNTDKLVRLKLGQRSIRAS